MIDERTRAALSRLTENERACLARRLQHQTAKEMAIDLGISPHAVEKRLKMARTNTKLGVSSSLEAARLLEANERYGRAGPQASDLGEHQDERQESSDPRPTWRRIAPYALTGVIAMSLVVIALLALAPLNAPKGGVAPLPVGAATSVSDENASASSAEAAHAVIGSTIKTYKEYEEERERETGHKYERPHMIKAAPETVKAFVNEVFDTQDKNHSGYLERAEAPATYA
ncbi:MAG: hypothetical protein J7498_00285 [Sphingobium sp.]|nr:hypothetical protein [Sphingobium sp.]